MTPIIDAIRSGTLCLEAINLTPESASERDDHGVSALMWAAYYQNQTALAVLRVALPQLTIHEAAIVGDLESVKRHLQDDPASAHAYSGDGFAPLGFAAFFGHLEVAKALIEAGADVNQRSTNGMGVCPLHSAMAHNHPEVANLLLDAGADPIGASHSGWTPLHYAAFQSQVPLAERLLQAGADRSALNGDGHTAAQIAEANGHRALTALLTP